MRVLLALDGSASSDVASQLVGSLSWPDASIIEVVGVVEPAAELIAPLLVPAPNVGSFDELAGHALELVLRDAIAKLEKPSLVVTRRILVGRPATRIIEAATELRADLIVIGSRGHGRLSSMLLGSVSAEVADHAPCPVLVVRRPGVSGVLVAVDGSPSAHGAVTYLLANPILAGIPVEVLAVAPRADLPGAAAITSISDFESVSFQARGRHARDQAEYVAAGAVERLRAHGYHARWSVSDGSPAHEIIDAAASFGSNLVIVGSRGHTGLTRLLLGSVARNVLLHTPVSVLIVREPVRAEEPATGRRAELSPVDLALTAGAN